MSKVPPRRGRPHRYADSPKGIGVENIRWSAVIVAGVLLLALLFGLAFGIRACAVRSGKQEPVSVSMPTPASNPEQGLTASSAPEPTGEPGSSLENPLDLSSGIIEIRSQEKSINTPDVFGHEMVYSAGTGSLLKPLLKTLYLYDLETGEEREVAKVKIKDGEIFETVLNNDYIAWLDTDQKGSNAIYVLDRNEENAKPRLIKECSFAVPKLRLSQDYLMWIEQNEEKEERLYVVDLISEENASIPGFAESIERAMSTYGVSAPGIYGTEIIWAASDPEQSQEDSILNGEKSAIYYCDLSLFAQDDYEPSVFRPDMYVHDPITNGEVWAWIDKNKAPDSTLYLKVGDEVRRIGQGVITYALGDEMLIFGKDGNIYAYFYKDGTYGRLNREGERGIMPVVSGRRVVWFNKSAGEGDHLDYLSVPYKE
jgi:hypothetical protein